MKLRTKKRGIEEVNMASMADIIFMLLIFFMLTSTLVKFLPFKLPTSDSRVSASIKVTVGIDKAGVWTVNDVPVEFEQLESTLRSAVQKAGNPTEPPAITIAAEIGVPFSQITKVMIIAGKMRAKTILATAPPE